MPRTRTRLVKERAQRIKTVAAGEYKIGVSTYPECSSSASDELVSMTSGRLPMLLTEIALETEDYPAAEAMLKEILNCEYAVSIFGVCGTVHGRSDVFFTIANSDVPKASVVRIGTRNIKCYYDCDFVLYPTEFLKKYETWVYQ